MGFVSNIRFQVTAPYVVHRMLHEHRGYKAINLLMHASDIAPVPVAGQSAGQRPTAAERSRGMLLQESSCDLTRVPLRRDRIGQNTTTLQTTTQEYNEDE